jgi:hypothetical protein
VVGVSRLGTGRIRLIAAVAWPNCLRGGELCGMTGLDPCRRGAGFDLEASDKRPGVG